MDTMMAATGWRDLVVRLGDMWNMGKRVSARTMYREGVQAWLVPEEMDYQPLGHKDVFPWED